MTLKNILALAVTLACVRAGYARPVDPYCPIGDFDRAAGGCVIEYRTDLLRNDAPIGRMTEREALEQIELAMEKWAEHVPIVFEEKFHTQPVDIYFVTHTGGPLGKWQRHGVSYIDSADWSANVCEEGGVSFLFVTAHEIGHSFGLGHDPAPSNSVMANRYRGFCTHHRFIANRDIELVQGAFSRAIDAMAVPEPGTGLLLIPSLAWLLPRPHRRARPELIQGLV